MNFVIQDAMPVTQNSALIDYALKGLDRCWLPAETRWSHIYHLDGRAQPNQSLPHSDVFYTINVLLGLSRVARVPEHIDVAAIFATNARQLLKLPVRDYAFGMALWAAAELDIELPADVRVRALEILGDKDRWRSMRAQDVGMLLTGVSCQARRDPGVWAQHADALYAEVVAKYVNASGLFSDAPVGSRRWFGSFASQVYLTVACYSYGEFRANADAIRIANACARKLISLQGPLGEWPWFFNSARGTVVDFYEVYSVHQYGMAPAFLEFSERHGVAEARDAVTRGFKWVLGANQLRKPMLRTDLSLSVRSQVRDGELASNKMRALRSASSMITGRTGALIDPAKVVLRQECRSYELGWILWSFGARTDYSELTDHRLFKTA